MQCPNCKSKHIGEVNDTMCCFDCGYYEPLYDYKNTYDDYPPNEHQAQDDIAQLKEQVSQIMDTPGKQSMAKMFNRLEKAESMVQYLYSREIGRRAKKVEAQKQGNTGEREDITDRIS